MDIQLATLSDILDFRPRELSNEEWSRLESLKDVVNLRRPLEEPPRRVAGPDFATKS
jgi:hypothetical protein